MTINDIINADCECVGIPIYTANCDYNNSSISYTKSVRNKIRITEDIDLSTLSIVDKLMFQESSYTQKHFEYMSTTSFATHDILPEDEENYFPEYYVEPGLIRVNETGVISYITKPDPNLNNGWVGDYMSNSIFDGVFEENNTTGQKTHYIPYTNSKSEEYYQTYNEMAKSQGFAYQYSFVLPTQSVLQEFSNLGFDVSSSNGIISVDFGELKIVWDNPKKTIV